jgi:hypothetical protein
MNTHYEIVKRIVAKFAHEFTVDDVVALVQKHPDYLRNKNTSLPNLEKFVRGDLRQLRDDGFITAPHNSGH